ncbi:MAG: diguanylate cyclase [Candidatus Omnitrophica bacterium]|nr:diguanylate cyclase [Candidatus Omnitrophota bacterium]MBU4479575.1 diguanylate cyclase [Candidatus Omnitrophota bacterium]MCG2704436.1 diguanylate cyclase [Candidatus Omnitrophota bacterium]
MTGKILIVEDNPADMKFLKETLEREKYETICSKNGEGVFPLLESNPPDLVILDILLPDIDGFDVCRRIRQNDLFISLPVLFYTTISTINEKLIGLEVGASDFLTKSADERELLIRIRNLLNAKKKIDKIVKLSFYDELTEIYNRRYFYHRLRDECERSKRYKRNFCCAIMDIDYFKTINDTFGHPTGDRVLKEVAEVTRSNIRTADVLCRYGGDEFAVLLPETDLPGACVTTERVRRFIANLEAENGEKPHHVTISCGISVFSESIKDMNELMSQADNALYKAKQEGRNQIKAYIEK